MPDFNWDAFSGELQFISAPGTVDRCLRILLPGVADLPGSRGSIDRYRQRRRAADGYQTVWHAESSPVRKLDPDIQHVRMVFVLLELTHEPDSKRNT